VVLSDDLYQCQRQSDALRGPHLRRRIVHKEGLIDGRSPRQSFHSAAHVACEVGDHHESLVARGAQGGQLMGIAISMHSEAQSEASSEASLEAISVPKARTATGDRGRVRGRRLMTSDHQAALTACNPRPSPGHRRADEEGNQHAIRGHHLVIGEHSWEATVPVPVGFRRRGEHLHARQGQRRTVQVYIVVTSTLMCGAIVLWNVGT